MPLDIETAIKWGTPEDVLKRLGARNKRLRIINDSLYIKTKGSKTDPVKCWNSDEGKYVYVRKVDWLRASPAIRRSEACILLRITGQTYTKYVYALGLRSKKAILGRVAADIPWQSPNSYWSVDDVVAISGELDYNRGRLGVTPASPQEIRKIFASGYVAYKKTQSGDFIPVWDESIY